MIRITDDIAIDEADLDLRQIRSSGPGGQNVNKLASAVQLRFDVDACESLPPAVRRRLKRLAGSRMTQAGELILTARTHRSAERNRADVIDRFVEMIRKAAVPPKPRRKTKPTRASKKRRLESKRQRGETKSRRRKPRRDD